MSSASSGEESIVQVITESDLCYIVWRQLEQMSCDSIHFCSVDAAVCCWRSSLGLPYSDSRGERSWTWLILASSFSHPPPQWSLQSRTEPTRLTSLLTNLCMCRHDSADQIPPGKERWCQEAVFYRLSCDPGHSWRCTALHHSQETQRKEAEETKRWGWK